MSRTTLLYYEKLGLIRPLRQGGSRYRHFRPEDLQTLLAIARWRAAGVPLTSVRQLLREPRDAARVLRDHLRAVDRTLDAMRRQRRLTLELLEARAARASALLTKAEWTAMFRAIGLTPAQMRRWHAQFESRNGVAHDEFLRSLGLGRAEIGRIRKWSRE